MPGIIEEIRQQPHHIRQVFMWLSVIVTFSVIGFFWFSSVQRQFVALIDPNAATQSGDQQRAFAVSGPPESPFSTLLHSWYSLQANLAQLVDFKNNSLTVQNASTAVLGDPHTLPVSKDKSPNSK